MSYDVLVLNSDYEPLNVCNSRRAMTLMYLGKVDVLHSDALVLRSATDAYIVPSVVRLRNHIRRPMPQLKLSRRSILARDNYTCQYCGQRGGELTVDHVTPRRLGGPDTWDNLVCCCRTCNGKKGDKTLAQLGLQLKTVPKRPKYVPFISLTKYLSGTRKEIWRDYLPAFQRYENEPESIQKLVVSSK